MCIMCIRHVVGGGGGGGDINCSMTGAIMTVDFMLTGELQHVPIGKWPGFKSSVCVAL